MIGYKHKTNKPKISDSELIILLVYASTFRKREREIKSTLKEFKENYSDIFLYVPQIPAIVKRAKQFKKIVKLLIILCKEFAIK